MNSEWSTGFFVGINGRTIEYLVATEPGEGGSCATIGRVHDDEAYDPACVDLAKTTHRDFVLVGASSTPVSVGFADVIPKNADAEPIA